MASTRYRGELKADAVTVGQSLIAVRHASFSHDTIDSVWKIQRVTKTRAIIEMLRVVEGAEVTTSVTKRLIVRDGNITSREEGRSEYSQPYDYFTEDDEALVKIRAVSKVENAKGKAHSAAETFTKRRELDTAKAAIEALQAFVAVAEKHGEDH